jgi:RimJ/RimL family protein N-acetyltransferase
MDSKLNFPFDKSLTFPLGVGGLRELIAEDELPLIQIALNEPELFRFTLHPMKTQEEIKAYFQLALAQRRQYQEYPFAILHPDTAEVIGTTRFYLIQPAQASIAIGYTWISSEFHGTGLNQRIKHLMLQFALETLRFQRVEFRTDADNLRTIQALQRLGAISEGELRSHMFRPNGTRRNTRIFSILRDEYNK